ncbi:MAG: RNase P subunit p30 family protein [Promethearchaeota archaeon]
MSYFESRLPVNLQNFNDSKKRLEICEDLGIRNLILDLEDNTDRSFLDLREKIEAESKIKIYFRGNLRTNNIEDFKVKIKKLSRFYDILSLESLNREVQLIGAKDSRVDIVSFSDPEILKTLTPGVISLSKQNNTFIEFSLAPILVQNKTAQSKNFRNLYKFTHMALKLKANFIISGNFLDMFDYRHPRTFISICYSLLGIPISLAKDACLKNPKIIVNKKSIKIENGFEPEVKLI